MEKKQRIIIISVVVCVIILAVSLCVIFSRKNNNEQQQIENNQNQVESNRIVTEDGITKLNIIQNINGLEFSNVEIQMTSDRDCELRAQVRNTTSAMIEAQTVGITVTDDIGELREVFAGQVASIPVNETRTLSATIRADLTSATNVEFEIEE